MSEILSTYQTAQCGNSIYGELFRTAIYRVQHCNYGTVLARSLARRPPCTVMAPMSRVQALHFIEALLLMAADAHVRTLSGDQDRVVHKVNERREEQAVVDDYVSGTQAFRVSR